MIAFGTSITVPDVYERRARRGISLAAEPDSRTHPHAAVGSIARTYNLIMEQVAGIDDLEALVLVHQDAEIIDAEFAPKVRQALADQRVGVVGCVGARDVRGIAWWEGSVSWTSSLIRYGEMGGGDMAPAAVAGDVLPPRSEPGEVHTLYGLLLVLSAWTVRNLRFDESLALQYGYDYDLCRQVRAAGRKVVAADLEVAHHHSLGLITDIETWAEAHMAAAEKWDDRVSESPGSDGWRSRARRAEAGAAAARLQAASKLLQAYAQAQEDDERLASVLRSPSWRITEPLRRLNRTRRSR